MIFANGMARSLSFTTCLLDPSFIILPPLSLSFSYFLFLILHLGDVAIFTEQMFPYAGSIPGGNTVIYSRDHRYGLKIRGDGKLCLHYIRYARGEGRGMRGRGERRVEHLVLPNRLDKEKRERMTI